MHPPKPSSTPWFSFRITCSSGFIKQGFCSSQIWMETDWKKEREHAVDSPDGDSLASHFMLGAMCVRLCVIHHPICQQRRSSASSRTKKCLGGPLIGLNVHVLLP
ncbi:hypothetical protein ILYODFUR_002107 [Ilyodon furcidens]|uniref:Uncharacterized protein n=1 Tax=Ilyodon furcidens TaxID=33524 RepID=A0ABV0U340_9TELE